MSDHQTLNRGRKRAIVAGVAGVALLVGGTTYALWTDSTTVSGGTITSGSMSIDKVGDYKAYDTSANRSHTGDVEIIPGDAGEKGHEVSLVDTDSAKAWRIVPGDQATLKFGFKGTLIGDNLVAQLTLDAKAFTSANPNKDMKLKFRVYDSADQPMGDWADVSGDQAVMTTIASATAAKGGNTVPKIDGYADAQGDFQVSVLFELTFDQPDNRDVDDPNSYTKTTTDLSNDITVTMQQVRPTPAP